MKRIRAMLFLLVISQVAFAEFSIHVLNPWNDNANANIRDSLRMVGNAEVNYYPGSAMVSEGGGWFFWTYKTVASNSNTTFKITTWVGPKEFNGAVTYGRTLRIDSLFARVPAGTEDIWVELNPDTTKFPNVYATPPRGSEINLFNPWPENSPKIIINGGIPVQMRTVDGLCGWYRYYYGGPSDSLKNISFTDYYTTKKYTSTGLATGTGIDLRSILKSKDTVFILPTPFPAGAPKMTNVFPGRQGDCNTRKVSGIFRDWKLNDTSFFNQPMGKTSGGRGMVMPTLNAPDYKPKLNPVYTSNPPPLEKWFNTVKLSDGKENDTCIDLTMTKGYDGRWTYDSDNYGGFFPLDNFNSLNNVKYLDNTDPSAKGAKMHNFHFTMEMHMQFIYRQGLGLEFDFKGDDDVWIYVNNILAIDLGGLNYLAVDTLRLDKKKDALKLVDGQIYNMDIFYAERNPVGSNLLIKTSMDLHNSGDLYYKELPSGNGKTQYDIWQQRKSEANDCGLTRLSDGEELSSVDFSIEGPQFANETPLPPGSHFGGIIVDANKSRITIDSANITGLKPGEYKVYFVSTFDKNRSGFFTFTVVPIPDHLDLFPDSMALDINADAKIESVSMGIDKDSLQLYSVIRDINGIYIEDGTNLSWKSRDEKVVTVSPSKTNKSKAMITKVDGGSTWIVVSQNGLKSDSVLIHATAKPVWPLIKSAVMSDSRGDLIANLLYITLSDTFKLGQTLTSVEITYKNKTYSVPGANCKIEGNRIAAPFTSLTGIDTKPTGSATIIMDVNGREQRHTGAFTDGVGPVLISAEVLEKESGETDVLHLTFSEPVYPAKLLGGNLLLIRNGDIDTVTLTIANVREAVNDSTYSVVLISTVNPPLPGEKLRLVPASKGGGVSDLKDNRPHDLNKPVIIELRKGAAAVLKSWYRDTNADGVLDSLFVQFKRAIELSELDNFSIGWNQKVYKVESGKFLKVNDSTILIPIRGSVVDAEKIVTSGVMDIQPAYKYISNVPSRSIPSVIDSAAPVIVTAKLMRGGYNDAGSKEMDTLQITFSETVQTTGDYPFLLKSGNSTTGYQFKVSPPSVKGILYTFIVDKIDPSTVSPVKGDSIWINEKGGVVGGGIQQVNEKNHRALLDIVQPPTVWISKVGPNPLIIPGGQLTIKVMSKRNVDFSPYTAGIKIYDALNNIIENTSMNLDDKSFVYNWSGHNKNGRLVGAGTYLAVVTVSENGHKIWSQTRNLGVKR